jgi:hypothetical protein
MGWRLIAAVPGPAPDPDRDALAGDGQADHDLRQVVAAVLGLAVGAQPGRLVRVGVILAGGLLAAPVPGHLIVGFLQLQVRQALPHQATRALRRAS